MSTKGTHYLGDGCEPPHGTPTMRGEHCEEVGPGGETCIFGRKHAAGHHLTPDGERWVSASTLNLRLRPGRIAPTISFQPERDTRPQPVRDIEALRERVLAEGTDSTPPELRQRPGDQPLPIPNDRPDVQSMVIADIEARRELGIRRYGVALQPFNGRDALLDCYEEALDLAVYLRQVRAEAAAGHRPHRDDAIAAWLKTSRDENARGGREWNMLDDLLDEYRLRADLGLSLAEELDPHLPGAEQRYPGGTS